MYLRFEMNRKYTYFRNPPEYLFNVEIGQLYNNFHKKYILEMPILFLFEGESNCKLLDLIVQIFFSRLYKRVAFDDVKIYIC